MPNDTRSLWCRVACGCGWSEGSTQPDEEVAVAWAQAAAEANDCDDDDYCRVWVDIGYTLRIDRSPIRLRSSSEKDLRAVLRADPCAYCGAPGEHLDHIVPRAGGGANTTDNLTSACAPCNARKRSHSLLGFLGLPA